MTEKEAIEYLSGKYLVVGSLLNPPEEACKKHNAALDMAIGAMEKQIAMKPILKNGESVACVDYADGHGECKAVKWQDLVCPVCGWFVGQRYNGFQKRPHDQRKSNYCNECGQRIDWSEVDERLPSD